jgi:Na+-transporting NADH:ubiquinone oxidoreductase subunit NqrF
MCVYWKKLVLYNEMFYVCLPGHHIVQQLFHPSSNLTLSFRAMAAKALANEAYLEEYNRLELELKQLQHELSDSVVLNDELTKVISQKVNFYADTLSYFCFL